MVDRYIAQARVAEIGPEGQRKLRDASALIVGCGALGSPLAMYLAGTGLGHITLADFDTVDITNLHRQVFFTESETGLKKAALLRDKMLRLNSSISVEVIEKVVSRRLLDSMGRSYDVIVDAADNPSTTFALSEFCASAKRPFVTAGVSGWEAQIFTFIPGSFAYHEVFPRPSDEGGVMPCSIAGIVGPVAGFAASLQAISVIKIITGVACASSSLLSANMLTGEFNSLS